MSWQDPTLVCDAEKPRPDNIEKPYRAVLCNRPPGHAGPHRKYDRYSFAILAEWTETSTAQPRR